MCFLDVRGKPEHDIEEKETEYDSNKRKSEDDRKTKPRSQNGFMLSTAMNTAVS